MKNYLIYEEDPGPFIKKVSSSNEDQLLLNVAKSEKWIESDYSPKHYFIKSGKPKKYPQKPDYPSNFNYELESWIAEEDSCWANLRRERDSFLSECDWTQMPDAPVDKAAWAEYRQKLRDLPQNTTDPTNVDWPEKPK